MTIEERLSMMERRLARCQRLLIAVVLTVPIFFLVGAAADQKFEDLVCRSLTVRKDSDGKLKIKMTDDGKIFANGVDILAEQTALKTELTTLKTELMALTMKVDGRIKDIKFHYTYVQMKTTEQEVTLEAQFPEPVDFVALCGLGWDNESVRSLYLEKMGDGKAWKAKFVGVRGKSVEWIPGTKLLGVKIVR